MYKMIIRATGRRYVAIVLLDGAAVAMTARVSDRNVAARLGAALRQSVAQS
jgi:hypothetical protein